MTVTNLRSTRHRLVRADAGTGKTYALTVQFLRLLTTGTEPQRILATTFTRKAAGEILQRILLRVAEAALAEEAAERLSIDLSDSRDSEGTDREDRADRTDTDRTDRARSSQDYSLWLERLVDVLPRLAVGTLDAFFRRLVAGFRYELGLVRMQTIAAVGDPLVEELRARAVRATLDRLATSEDALSDLTSRLYRGQAQRSVSWAVDRVFLELYEVYREAKDIEIWSRLEVPAGLLEEDQLAAATAALVRLVESGAPQRTEVSKGSARAKPHPLAKTIRDDLARLEQRDWAQFLKTGLAAKVDGFHLGGEEPIFSRKPIPPEIVSLYLPLVAHARADLIASLREQTLATHRLLSVFDEEFTRLRRREGVILFGDLAEHIAHGLRALDIELQLALAYRLDGRIEHVLLDEFQDTSTIQWSALGVLVKEVLSWGDGSRALFCVGDPKQSIYGWRGGRPELFELVEEKLAPMIATGAASVEPLGLSYRTPQLVLDVVNTVFDGLTGNEAMQPGAPEDDTVRAKAAEEWARGFAPHQSALVGGSSYVVLRTTGAWEGSFEEYAREEDEVDPDEAVEEPHPLGHLEDVAQRIAEIVQRWPSASIGVLVKTNRTVGECLLALRALDIEASGEGRGRVVDDPVVTCVLSAFRLAASPTDTVSLVHLSGTPLGNRLGVPEALAQGPVDPQLLSDAAARVSANVRERVMADGACVTLARWCREISSGIGPRSRARLQQLLEVILEQQDALDRDPRRLVRFLANVTVEEPAPCSVRVMTVHQAKGLEFDAVVLCDLETNLGRLLNPLVNVRRPGPLSAPSEVFRSTNATTRRSSVLLQEAHQQEIERRMRDDLSVVYVALTRARRELHLLVQPRQMIKKGPASDGFTVAGLLRGALCARLDTDRTAAGNEVLFEVGEPTNEAGPEPSTELERGVDAIDSGQHTSTRSSGPEVSTDRGRRERTRGASRPSATLASDAVLSILATRSNGVVRGRLLHAYYAEIGWLPARGVAVAAEVRRRLERLHAPAAPRPWLDGVWSDFERQLATPALNAILRRPSEGRARVWRERAFAYLPGPHDLEADTSGESDSEVADMKVTDLKFTDPEFSDLKFTDPEFAGEVDSLVPDGNDSMSTSDAIDAIDDIDDIELKDTDASSHQEPRRPPLMRGVIDRVVTLLEPDGSAAAAEVIDFKTGGPSERDQSYRRQLEIYRAAVAAITGLVRPAVRARIVWLDLDRIEDV